MLSTVLFTALTAIIIAIYYFSRRKFNYWKKQNVPYLEPTTIFGNYADVILLKKHVKYVLTEICQKFPNAPYIGAFYGTEPTLIVKDPEIVKLITTKDFYYFNGREVSNYAHNEFINENIFFSGGDNWKVARQSLTPVFTSAKMKNMFHLIAKCSFELERLLDSDTKVSNVIEARPFMARYTMACISSCAFGIDSDTMGDDYTQNPFTKAGRSFFYASKWTAAKITLKAVWPKIFYSLRFKITPAGMEDFFLDMMKSVFEARQLKPTSRNDFVDFILTFKQKRKLIGDSVSNMKTGGGEKAEIPITDSFMVSQCMGFFLAGYETSATTSSYTLFELAKHPEAQKKCQEEVDDYLRKHGTLTYDVVTELPYLNACVDETLRLYPVLPNLTREVMDDYTLPDGVHLEKGVRIHIPVDELHMNPKYFPEPEVFRPERFLGGQTIVPHSYIPFGDGGRICLGMRFAKMQVLSGLVTILKKFEIDLDVLTPKKVHFEAQYLVPTPAQPLKLKLSPREGWESRVFDKA